MTKIRAVVVALAERIQPQSKEVDIVTVPATKVTQMMQLMRTWKRNIKSDRIITRVIQITRRETKYPALNSKQDATKRLKNLLDRSKR